MYNYQKYWMLSKKNASSEHLKEIQNSTVDVIISKLRSVANIKLLKISLFIIHDLV